MSVQAQPHALQTSHRAKSSGRLYQAVLWHWGRNVGEESGRKRERDQINVEKPSYQRGGRPLPTKAKHKGQSMHQQSKWICKYESGGGTMQMTHKMS